MLSGGSYLSLAQEHLKSIDQLGSRRRGFDDVVDKAAARCNVRCRKPVLVVLDYLVPGLDRIHGVRDISLEDDVRGSVRTHDSYLCVRPGEHHVRSQVLAAHRKI